MLRLLSLLLSKLRFDCRRWLLCSRSKRATTGTRSREGLHGYNRKSVWSIMYCTVLPVPTYLDKMMRTGRRLDLRDSITINILQFYTVNGHDGPIGTVGPIPPSVCSKMTVFRNFFSTKIFHIKRQYFVYLCNKVILRICILGNCVNKSKRSRDIFQFQTFEKWPICDWKWPRSH